MQWERFYCKLRYPAFKTSLPTLKKNTLKRERALRNNQNLWLYKSVVSSTTSYATLLIHQLYMEQPPLYTAHATPVVDSWLKPSRDDIAWLAYEVWWRVEGQ